MYFFGIIKFPGYEGVNNDLPKTNLIPSITILTWKNDSVIIFKGKTGTTIIEQKLSLESTVKLLCLWSILSTCADKHINNWTNCTNFVTCRIWFLRVLHFLLTLRLV